MGRFFARWVSQQVYITERSPNHKPYVKHPADPDVKTWQTRRAAEKWVALRPEGMFEVVEAPSFWRKRDPITDAEWNELALFFHERSGEALKQQTQITDEILEKLEE